MPVFKVTVSKVNREVRYVDYNSSFHIEAASLEGATKAAGLINAGKFDQDMDDVVNGEWDETDNDLHDCEPSESDIESVKEVVGNLIEPDITAEEVIKYSEEHS